MSIFFHLISHQISTQLFQPYYLRIILWTRRVKFSCLVGKELWYSDIHSTLPSKMNLLSVLLLSSLLKISSCYFSVDSIGQFFLESSVHVDFSSSFYNNIKFYFPEFDTEGKGLIFRSNIDNPVSWLLNYEER